MNGWNDGRRAVVSWLMMGATVALAVVLAASSSEAQSGWNGSVPGTSGWSNDFGPSPDDYRNRGGAMDDFRSNGWDMPRYDSRQQLPSRNFDEYNDWNMGQQRSPMGNPGLSGPMRDRLSRGRNTDDYDLLRDYQSRRPSYDRNDGSYLNDPWNSDWNRQNPRDPWSTPSPMPQPTYPTRPATPAEPTAREIIAKRYGDPKVANMLRQLSPQAAEALFVEVSQYVDGRHVSPTPYSQRVSKALENIAVAAETSELQNLLQIRPNGQQLQSLYQGLRQVPVSSAQNMNDAIGMMRQVGQIASQTANIPPAVVTLEFVYASMESLDKFSMLVPAELSGAAKTGLENNFVGIGVEVEMAPNGLKIVKPITGGPAHQATLQRGDVISGVNGQRLAGMTMDQAVALIAGPAGTQVSLELVRGSMVGDITLTRRQVIVNSVAEVKMLDPQQRIGYIKLEKFAEATTRELDAALWSLHNQGMQSLVMDLRGNPGGLLTTAIDVSNRFLPQGTIVSTKGRNPQDNSVEQASLQNTWKVPLVVLIDSHSASASEIFAAAIQENGRGLIVGETSYGKGTVQTLFPLRTAGAALRLTTAKFYAPSGREMASVGVTPDLRVSGLQGPDADALAFQAAVSAINDPRMQQFQNVGFKTGDASKVLTIEET
jgi:carboxyl-terminal processing protease